MTEEIPFPETTSLHELTWWMFDVTAYGMGAHRQFDYAEQDSLRVSDRLGRCYELAAKGIQGWWMLREGGLVSRELLGTNSLPVSGSPAPTSLVHGTWHGPNAAERIAHAWLVLDDGRVWEPVTSLICDPVLFEAYTRAVPTRTYTEKQARVHMLRSGHFGPWHEDE